MNFTNNHHIRVVNLDFLNKNIPKNNKCLPKIEKLSVNGNNKSSLLLLELLAYKKPIVILGKESKIKGRKLNGCKIDLRKKSVYDFLDRFIFEILPSSKDISVLKKNNMLFIKDVFAFNDVNILYNVINDIKMYSIKFEPKIKETKFLSGFRLPTMDE